RPPSSFDRAASAGSVEQQFERAFVAGGDLERRQRFFLRFGLVAGEQVAFTEIAMRIRLVGGAGLQRGAEFANRGYMILALQRQPAGEAVRRGVERVERDDAIQRRGSRALVAGRLRDLEELARGLDVGVV